MATACILSIEQVVRENSLANGLAIIVSNDYQKTKQLLTLEGTIRDNENMKRTFESLMLAVISRHNVSHSEMLALLSVIVNFKKFPPTYKRLVFVFSGHGNSDHLLYTNDEILSTISIKDVLEHFYAALHLAKIPKMFFIDACRGDQRNPGLTVPRGGKSVTDIIPAEGNWLLAYSTLPKHKSYEEQGKGGVWMSKLADKLRTADTSLADILTSVNEKLMALYRQDKTYPLQQPEFISRLNTNIYFLREAKQIKLSSPGGKASVAYSQVRKPISHCPRANSVPAPAAPPMLEPNPNPVSSLPAGIKISTPKKKSPKGSVPTVCEPRERIEQYCRAMGKKPSFTSERSSSSRRFVGKAYIPKTCGWITGDLKITKTEAEKDAAIKLMQKLNIPFS